VERRLRSLEIMAAARQGSLKLVDLAVAITQTVITKTSPTHTTLLHTCLLAASASPNCTDVVSKVEHEASLDTYRNFSECEVRVTNLGA
jgi:hypothetical protein